MAKLLPVKENFLCRQVFKNDSITIISDMKFNAEDDAKALKTAMDGMGTNEDTIINIICNRGIVQRLKIVDKYLSCFGEDLRKRLKSELSGHFRSTVLALITPLPKFYAKELHHAISGIGTYEDVLIEILGTLSNKDVKAIADSYTQMYKTTLQDAIEKDTSGHFKNLCVSLLVGNRDESSNVNEFDVESDAKDLYQAGRNKWGTDESAFNRILVNRSYEHLRHVFHKYKELYSETIEKSIENEFFADTYMSLLSIVQVVQNKELYFANRLKRAMSGLGTDDRTLIRIFVTRSEVDIKSINRVYSTISRKCLTLRIQRNTRGYYRGILLKIIK